MTSIKAKESKGKLNFFGFQDLSSKLIIIIALPVYFFSRYAIYSY